MKKMSLNIEQVQQFLAERCKSNVTDVTTLSGGQWSQAFGYRLAGHDLVIRFGQHVEDYKKDQIAASFDSEYLPVPKVTEIGEASGGYYAISERVFGVMLDSVDSSEMKKMIPAIFKMLDALREIKLTEDQVANLWHTNDTAPRRSWHEFLLDVGKDDNPRTGGWRTKLANSPVGDAPFNKALERLQELVKDCPGDTYVIHSDLLHNNVLVQDNRITAVIDWGCALYGDFLYDLAWFSFWSSWFPAMEGINWEAEARKHYAEIGLAVPNFEKRLLCYKLHIGLGGQAYNAFMERWDELEINAKNTLDLISHMYGV